jgi:hypothetical protein
MRKKYTSYLVRYYATGQLNYAQIIHVNVYTDHERDASSERSKSKAADAREKSV